MSGMRHIAYGLENGEERNIDSDDDSDGYGAYRSLDRSLDRGPVRSLAVAPAFQGLQSDQMLAQNAQVQNMAVQKQMLEALSNHNSGNFSKNQFSHLANYVGPKVQPHKPAPKVVRLDQVQPKVVAKPVEKEIPDDEITLPRVPPTFRNDQTCEMYPNLTPEQAVNGISKVLLKYNCESGSKTLPTTQKMEWLQSKENRKTGKFVVVFTDGTGHCVAHINCYQRSASIWVEFSRPDGSRPVYATFFNLIYADLINDHVIKGLVSQDFEPYSAGMNFYDDEDEYFSSADEDLSDDMEEDIRGVIGDTISIWTNEVYYQNLLEGINELHSLAACYPKIIVDLWNDEEKQMKKKLAKFEKKLVKQLRKCKDLAFAKAMIMFIEKLAAAGDAQKGSNKSFPFKLNGKTTQLNIADELIKAFANWAGTTPRATNSWIMQDQICGTLDALRKNGWSILDRNYDLGQVDAANKDVKTWPAMRKRLAALVPSSQ